MMAAYLLTTSFTWEPEEKVYPQFSNLVSQYAIGLADVTKMVKIEPMIKIEVKDGDHTNFGEDCQTTSGASASHAGEKELQVVKQLQHHQCEYCSKVLASRRNLVRHTLSHTREQPFKCKTCEKAFARRDSLKKHMKTHDREKTVYGCGVCEKTFKSSASLSRHHTRDHENKNTQPEEKKLFQCEICGKNLASFTSFRRHTSIHCKDQGQQQGEIGDKTSRKKEKLLEACISKQKRQQPQCSKHKDTSPGKSYLHSNENTGHGEKTQAGSRHVESNILSAHMNSQDNDIHECGVGDNTSASFASLSSHTTDHNDKNTRPGEKKWLECGICGETFPSLVSFCLHTSDCRKKDCQGEGQTSSGANESPAGERALRVAKQQKHHACESCGKVLKWKHNLARHTLIHCGKAFAKKDILLNHVHKHVKEKTVHECGVCERTFASLESLISHLTADHQTSEKVSSSKTASSQLKNEHTKKCTYCDKAFSTASDLEAHVDGHAFSLAAHILKHRRQQFQHERGKVSPVWKLQHHSLEKRTDEDKGQVEITSSISFPNSALGDSLVNVAVKQYNCRLCGESFAWKSLLAIHMHNHRKENPHKCETNFL